MYSSIYKFALERGVTANASCERRKVCGHIKLSKDGEYEGFEPLPVPKRVFCPVHRGRKRYLAGEEALNLVHAKRKEITALMEEAAESVAELKAISHFMEKLDKNSEFAKEVEEEILKCVKKNSCISFRIGGYNLETSDCWREWLDAENSKLEASDNSTEPKYAISAITGEKFTVTGNSYPKIMASQTGSGAPVFSADSKYVNGDRCAFRSYGEDPETLTAISRNEAWIIKRGLEHLLETPTHHNNDFGILYWFGRKEAEDALETFFVFGEGDQKPETVQRKKEAYFTQLLELISKKGGSIADIDDTDGYLHLMNFRVPAKGRFYLYGERMFPIEELCKNILKWYKDTTLKHTWWLDKVPYEQVSGVLNMWSVFYAITSMQNVDDKAKHIKKTYGEDVKNFLYAALYGEAIPKSIYTHALDMVTKSMVTKDVSINSVNKCLQLIKAYLIRKGDKEMEKMTELADYSGKYASGYNAGRWFAAVCKLQEDANAGRELNASMAKKYYKAAKKKPAAVLAMVNDNLEVYLGKLSREKKGLKIFYEKLFAELAGVIGTGFPSSLTIEEQGAFDLGFAQQKQALYKKSTETENGENTCTEEHEE